ncbi:hypothetical protein F5B18DRAFT_441363 [Nemania serpens]|nr:hypothetical protein F5B18DRAFT_441363 [Nemania serpens]
MDQPIHLVLVNGLAILQKEVDGSPKTILSQLFPRAIIDDFSFLSPSTVEWRLHQRALALLEQLLKTWGACKTLPIVFLAHGLGGFVVKQKNPDIGELR